MSETGGHRYVFFGLDGAFSAVTLEALCASGRPPALVVIGRGPQHARNPLVRRHRPKRALFSRTGPTDTAAPLGTLETQLLALAERRRLVALEVEDPGALRARAAIADAKPEAFVVAGFHRLLPELVLRLAPRGGINVHPGRLPEERGPAPLFWSLKRGATTHGLCIHLLEAGEDSGDLLFSTTFDVAPGLDGQAILRRAAEVAAPALIRLLRNFMDGEVVRTPQPEGTFSRCPRPSFADGKIDPELSAEAVYVFVSGCARSHSLFVDCAGDRFFVAGAESYDASASLAFDYVLSGDRLILRCSPGVVELALKPDGVLFSAEYDEPELR